jgi:hypothetical protein
MEWIHLDGVGDRCQALLYRIRVMALQAVYEAEVLLTSWEFIRFSKITLFHGVHVTHIHVQRAWISQSVQRGATGLTAGDRIPAGARYYLSVASRPPLRPTQLPIQWVWEAVSTGVKRSGREADHSPPFSVEVKNGGVIPSLPHTF